MMGFAIRQVVYVTMLIAFLTKKHRVSGDTHSASADLTSVFQLEQQIVNVLSELVSQTDTKLGIVRRYLKEHEQSVIIGTTDDKDEFMERLAGNPIHAYRLMKRLYFDWQLIEKEIKTNNWQTTLIKLEEVRNDEKFPKEEDFLGATSALVRLQDTYELNITQLVRGNLQGRQTHAELTALDCLFMGKHAFDEGAYARAVEWLEQSYILAGLENNQTIRQDHIMEVIQQAIDKHDEALHGAQQREPMAVLSDTKSLFRLPLKEKSAVLQRNEIIRSRKYDKDDAAKFNALCRGESLLSEEILAQLKCWYETHQEPYLFLMPVKMEQNSIRPAIYTFHGVLSDLEIETIKELATPLLARAKVLAKQAGSKTTVSNARTSKTAWLTDTLHPMLHRISRRIALVTRLKVNSSLDEAEILQVANYGIGGHYSPHHDYLMKGKTDEEVGKMDARELAIGDRIATFMFYLNDVERGGSTAFPRAGVAVKPVKGGAAFWYNLKRNSQGDPDTLHGGCPVLLGHKWVSNKWIRETAQSFNRPCLLDPNE